MNRATSEANADDLAGVSAERTHDSRVSSLARNTVFNLIGQCLPLLVALLCLPTIVSGLGAERFGVLALSWTVVGYIGAFDLGLARASARFISAALARGATEEAPRILGTALFAEALLGIAGGALIAAAAPVLITRVFVLPAELQDEGRAVLELIALGVPVVLLSTSLRAALAAAQRFDLVNAVVVPASSSMYLLSTLGVLAGWSLPAIVAALVASKLVALAALWVLTRRCFAGFHGRGLSPDRSKLHDLVRFGSWLTVSSVMVPLLTYAERLLIPALISIGTLTFYAVPYEAVSRAAVLPVSMAMTLFPAFSRFDGREREALTDLVVKPMKCLLLIMTPALAFVGLFAHELLAAWMGTSFADQAAPALRVLAVAFYMAGFSHILRAVVQGLGRPDLKAKLDLGNAALFLALLFVLTPWFGLAGAAGAKLVTSCIELAALFLLAPRVAPLALQPRRVLRLLAAGTGMSISFVIGAAVAAAWMRGSPLTYASFGVLALVHTFAFWKWAGDAADRQAVADMWNWLAPSRRPGVLAAADAEEPL